VGLVHEAMPELAPQPRDKANKPARRREGHGRSMFVDLQGRAVSDATTAGVRRCPPMARLFDDSDTHCDAPWLNDAAKTRAGEKQGYWAAGEFSQIERFDRVANPALIPVHVDQAIQTSVQRVFGASWRADLGAHLHRPSSGAGRGAGGRRPVVTPYRDGGWPGAAAGAAEGPRNTEKTRAPSFHRSPTFTKVSVTVKGLLAMFPPTTA
jgi:hypothetical protein